MCTIVISPVCDSFAVDVLLAALVIVDVGTDLHRSL